MALFCCTRPAAHSAHDSNACRRMQWLSRYMQKYTSHSDRKSFKRPGSPHTKQHTPSAFRAWQHTHAHTHTRKEQDDMRSERHGNTVRTGMHNKSTEREKQTEGSPRGRRHARATQDSGECYDGFGKTCAVPLRQ